MVIQLSFVHLSKDSLPDCFAYGIYQIYIIIPLPAVVFYGFGAKSLHKFHFHFVEGRFAIKRRKYHY
jgi:hypothetical protein